MRQKGVKLGIDEGLLLRLLLPGLFDTANAVFYHTAEIIIPSIFTFFSSFSKI